ncbi:MAG: PQQ-binding-like beta-propeller repeat protein, partial [Planctomycetota bacterium]
MLPASAILFCACASAQEGGGTVAAVQGWLDWRGPQQTGTSLETDIFDTLEVDGEHHLWSYDLAGRGTPVVAEGRVYTLGYEGEGPDLQEMLVCLDERTGELIWERRWNDFLSDVIYNRYSVASPTIDPETGNVYVITTPGVIKCFSQGGDLLWEVSSMATLGRLSFPNGRTGSPVVDGERLIVHLITAHWGPTNGPARDRFYAFDKHTGELIWGNTPGTGPKDSPYSHPVLGEANGRRVLYAGLGCGNVVCIDARTGDNLWRYRLATGGVNSSPVLYGDSLIAIHGRENMDTST